MWINKIGKKLEPAICSSAQDFSELTEGIRDKEPTFMLAFSCGLHCQLGEEGEREEESNRKRLCV